MALLQGSANNEEHNLPCLNHSSFQARFNLYQPMAQTLASELLDVVDINDVVLRSMSRGEVHQHGLMHRSVHVLVFDEDGSLLLQKRSMQKDECGGMWDSSCAGHVESQQSYEETAPRELSEELGFSIAAPLDTLFKMQPTLENGWEFAMVYRTRYSGPFSIAEDEIDEIRWFTPECIDDWVAAGVTSTVSGQLTSGFCEIWQRFRAL